MHPSFPFSTASSMPLSRTAGDVVFMRRLFLRIDGPDLAAARDGLGPGREKSALESGLAPAKPLTVKGHPRARSTRAAFLLYSCTRNRDSTRVYLCRCAWLDVEHRLSRVAPGADFWPRSPPGSMTMHAISSAMPCRGFMASPKRNLSRQTPSIACRAASTQAPPPAVASEGGSSGEKIRVGINGAYGRYFCTQCTISDLLWPL